MLYNISLYSLFNVVCIIVSDAFANAAGAAPRRTAIAAPPPAAIGVRVMAPTRGFCGQPAYKPGSR